MSPSTSPSTRVLSPSEAARRLGVSVKALRLYEGRGLLRPIRTEAGWRAYPPQEMERAAQVVALRGLGFSLVRVARVLDGNRAGLEAALAEHQRALESQIRTLSAATNRVRDLRGEFAAGRLPSPADLTRTLDRVVASVAAFDLPWPWGGERFELRALPAMGFVVGPLGSGKTRLARCLAEALPGGTFLGLDRLAGDVVATRAEVTAAPPLAERVQAALAWLTEDGASASDVLLMLVAALEDGVGPLVVDTVEQGLDEATQMAVVAWLRRRGTGGRPVLLLTRSSAILDLAEVGQNETILFCPANHSPPVQVAPYPGSPGYEAVVSCLAPPAVRARTAGMVAWRPQAG